jgi:hypothetical protein
MRLIIFLWSIPSLQLEGYCEKSRLRVLTSRRANRRRKLMTSGLLSSKSGCPRFADIRSERPSRVLFTVRERSLFPAVATNSGFRRFRYVDSSEVGEGTLCSKSSAPRIRCTPERAAMDLAARDFVCWARAGVAPKDARKNLVTHPFVSRNRQ